MLLFWLLASVLTVGVVLVLVRPLLDERPVAGVGGDNTAEAADIAIYRDQLTELEADRAHGLISQTEAEAARAEIGRRLLARAGKADSEAVSASPGAALRAAGNWLPYAICFAVPGMALAIYLSLGSPWLPGRPAAERIAGQPSSNSRIDELIARVEARLWANPSEGQGWDVIAPVYLRLGRYADAAEAYSRALDLLGETPRRLSGFAESTVLASDGIVTEPARKAYLRLIELEPGRTDARLGLALAKEQDGRHAEAAADYQALLAEAPAGVPWRGFVEARLARLGGSPQRSPEPDKGPKPDDGSAAAISSLPEADRNAAIRQMVEGLAERLKTNGGDVAGWQRLVRSWSVLGEKGKAQAALEAARKALAGDPQGLAAVNSFARTLGFKS
ncbi:MAG: c-type cytochrome biogenesis protein CcmI [Hyphomicrobiaceae bacterium]